MRKLITTVTLLLALLVSAPVVAQQNPVQAFASKAKIKWNIAMQACLESPANVSQGCWLTPEEVPFCKFKGHPNNKVVVDRCSAVADAAAAPARYAGTDTWTVRANACFKAYPQFNCYVTEVIGSPMGWCQKAPGSTEVLKTCGEEANKAAAPARWSQK